MTRHTPGPWLLDMGADSFVIHWRGDVIAHKEHSHPLSETTRHDAMLLAAAPDLAFALTATLPLMQRMAEAMNGSGDRAAEQAIARVLEQIQAALRKAGAE
jgi:hypothetical protein